MPQPNLSGTPPILKFGGRALPNGQGTMAWVNLNDLTNWFWMDGNAFAGIQRQIGMQQQAYLARGVYTADDFNATTVTLNLRYLETTNGDFGKALGQLEMADEQYLTFDNSTYYKAKLSAVTNRVLLRNFQPYYYAVTLTFTVVHPWMRDFISAGSTTNVLNPNGGFEVLAGSNNIPMFRSFGGTSADGTLNAWTNASSWTISANVVTTSGSAGSRIIAGHSDWTDGRLRVRVNWVTGAQPFVGIHYVDSNNNIQAGITSSTNLRLQKVVGGVTTSTNQAITALTTGNWYWFELLAAGTSYTVNLYNDSAGALGSLVGSATITQTYSDAAIQSGQIAVLESGTTAFTAGGAFVDVCSWYADGHGATQNVVSGEPAFAMSKVSPFAGTYAASVNNLASGANGYWSESFTATASPYNYQGYIKATGAGTASINISGSGLKSVTQDNTWRQTADANLTPGAGAQTVRLQMNGAGTAYFDNVAVEAANDSTTGLFSQTFVDRVALTGGSGSPTTSFSLTYPGSVFCEPVWTINVPSSSTATIARFILTNTTSGEALTVFFASNLAGSTAYTFVIDSAAMTVSETVHSKTYDATGSFPRLYGPAGQVNNFTLECDNGTGTFSGLSLDTTWTNRWET